LHRFLETGVYKKQPATLSIAPSMDISISSNFERYLFYLADENASTLSSWMNQFETTGEVTIPNNLLEQARSVFSSASSSKQEIIAAMKDVYSREGYLLCPHTATSAVAVVKLNLPSDKTICLATAHPAKFAEAVSLAMGDVPPPTRPKELEILFSLPVRTTALQNSLSSVEDFVRLKLAKNSKSVWPYVLSVSAVVAIGAFVAMRYRK